MGERGIEQARLDPAAGALAGDGLLQQDEAEGVQVLLEAGAVVGQGVAGLYQNVGIHQTAAKPVGGGDDFRRADAAVLVGVNQVERAGVELQPACGAGERDP